LVLGLVQHVLAGEQFYAWQGGGAWCNGQRIRVSERAALRQALVATGFPYHNFQRADAYFEVLRTLTAEGRGIRRYGSAALDLAWVACGRFDVFFEYGLNAWDVAGGTVLVREAGGQVTDFAGHTGLGFLDKREMLAANAAVFPAVQAVVGGGFSGG
jgi:myo-inositol-1(or 4)-monophosphatase